MLFELAHMPVEFRPFRSVGGHGPATGGGGSARPPGRADRGPAGGPDDERPRDPLL